MQVPQSDTYWQTKNKQNKYMYFVYNLPDLKSGRLKEGDDEKCNTL